MENNKLEISGRVTNDPPPASYKQIPESDTEESILQRPKSLTKSIRSNEMDGSDEQMLEKEVSTDSKISVGDIKFIVNDKQNGEAKLDIGDIKAGFVGMTKEELMKYANDPFWIRLRWIMFIAFWFIWFAMLVGAIIIIVVAPKCAPPAPRTWWEQGPLTEVEHDIPQFKLQEIKDRKIRSIIVPNPEDSYKNVNDSTDILNLMKRAKQLELNVIIDLKPIATLFWFAESEQKEPEFVDYYIWQNYKSPDNGSGSPVPPNNWLSPNGNSAWKFSDIRGQFYYAPHNVPHLNFRNPAVIEEFSNILRQWIDAGAKGVRIRDSPYLLVDEKFVDEVSVSIPGSYVLTDYQFYTHSRTVNIDGIGEVLKQWKKVIREYKDNMGPLMIAEDLKTLDAYTVNDTLSIDLPRHSEIFSSSKRLHNALQLYNGLNSAFSILGNNWPLWQYNTNVTTLSSDVLNMITMLLPGSSLVSSDVDIDPELLSIREVPSIMFGSCHRELLANDTVFAYSRMAAGNPGYLVACNPSERLVTVNFTVMRNVSDEVTIQMLSPNYTVPDMVPKYKIPAAAVRMPPKSAIVLTYVPKSEESN